MIKVERINVSNIPNAIRGARNPMYSWDKSDSKARVYDKRLQVEYNTWVNDVNDDHIAIDTTIGEADKKLLFNLIKAGTDEAKFLRQINVSMDITAPEYWWRQIDKYKVATVDNSTSQMHKVHAFKIDKNMFSFELDYPFESIKNDELLSFDAIGSEYHIMVNNIVNFLEKLRTEYNRVRKSHPKQAKRIWQMIIKIMPQSFNYTKTWTGNYQNLRNIYFARRNHKLQEWKDFCKIIEQLPNAELITTDFRKVGVNNG